MISSEVQRTLVKSPPELWAEISDPESLARHLGEFGGIRITRVQPEQKVEWEADDASGTVVIKPSGWGTKVKLTVTRELAQPEPPIEGPAAAGGEPDEPEEATELRDELESDSDAAPILGALPELESPSEPPVCEAAEPDGEAELHTEAEPDAEAEPGAEATPVAQPEPEPRRGFFARLFGRRRPRTEEPSSAQLAEPAPQPIASAAIEAEPLSAALDVPERDFEPVDEPVRAHEPAANAAANEPAEIDAQPLGELASGSETPAGEQTSDTPDNSANGSEQQAATDDVSARAKLAEELAAEEVTAVLTGVLDRLGAAHHRPFSRA